MSPPLMPISTPEEERKGHRRRQPAWWSALQDEEKQALLARLSERALPTFDFFLFSLVSALLLVAAFALRSPALLVVAVLIAPLLAPLSGLSLGAATASLRFSLRNLFGLLVAALILFGLNALASWLAGLVGSRGMDFVDSVSGLSWASGLVALLASGWMSIQLARAPGEARLPSAALAFVVLVPVAAGGWALGQGETQALSIGLLTGLAHVGLAFLGGIATFLLLGVRPQQAAAGGYWGVALGGVLGTTLLLVALVSLRPVSPGPTVAPPEQTPSAVPSPSPSRPSLLTATPSATPSPSETSVAATDTPTPTLTPTPALGVIVRTDGQGAVLRDEPGGRIIGSVQEGALVEILGQQAEANNRFWILVRDQNGLQGWLALDLLATVTPSPTP